MQTQTAETILKPVPDFNDGLTEETREFIINSLETVCIRENIAEEMREKMEKLFIDALVAGEGLEKTIPTSVSNEGRALRDGLSEMFIKPESKLNGVEHFETALEHMKKGGNVILLQNHTSVMDILGTEHLIMEKFWEEVTKEWTYISGSPMNELSSLQGRVISTGFARFPVISERLKGVHNAKENNGVNNETTIKRLMRFTGKGGKLVVLYPEGKRAAGGMDRANEKSGLLPFAMPKSAENLMLLPTHIQGASDILSMDRDDPYEHSTHLSKCHPSKINMTIGEPVEWKHLLAFLENEDAKQQYIELGLSPDRVSTAPMSADIMGGLIAELGGEFEKDGFYNTPDQKRFMEVFRSFKT